MQKQQCRWASKKLGGPGRERQNHPKYYQKTLVIMPHKGNVNTALKLGYYLLHPLTGGAYKLPNAAKKRIA
jgi:hypothetical protein